jgi:predicted phage terminase large subunit-like protein
MAEVRESSYRCLLRHGKSNTVTETFPSYYMAKHAQRGVKKNVIQTSYSGDLAENFGRKNRDKVDEFGLSLFNVEISKSQATKGKWSLNNGATMVSVGVGGSVTGEGADLLIIDDPVKNRQEAESETYRDRLWDEWTSTLRTRLHDGASVIVILTRWHEDDLAGRLIAGGGWEVISFPTICESENDLLGRKIGQTLCPELGFDEEWAEQTKKDVGSRAWESLYQQTPTAASVNLFMRDCFKIATHIPKTFDEVTQSWDFTFKDSKTADFVCCGVWGKKGADHYLLYRLKKRMSFTETLQAFTMVTNSYPMATLKIVEEKANGSAIISMLRKKIHGIVAINPKESKEARANAVSPIVESGNVYIPFHAEWKDDYINEMVSFPNGKNDDQVDMTTQYLQRHINKPQAVHINIDYNDDDGWEFE